MTGFTKPTSHRRCLSGHPLGFGRRANILSSEALGRAGGETPDWSEKMSDDSDCKDIDLFGPAPILSTEYLELYETIATGLVAAHRPKDAMEKLLVRKMVDSIWEVERYVRHKNRTIDRKFREHLEYQARQTNMLPDGREEPDRGYLSKEKTAEINRLSALDRASEAGIRNLNKAIEQFATDLDHARALEEGAHYYERLDRLHSEAFKRFREAFAMLGQYREVTRYWHRSRSTEIVDGEFREASPKIPR
jgi:hypothetical protein